MSAIAIRKNGWNKFDRRHFVERLLPPSTSLLANVVRYLTSNAISSVARRTDAGPLSIRLVTDATDATQSQVFHLGIVKDITEQKRLSQHSLSPRDWRSLASSSLESRMRFATRFWNNDNSQRACRELQDRKTVQPLLMS